ncbi:MAG: TlpA disulfide reductase family protein [Planctomycetota bacterium]
MTGDVDESLFSFRPAAGAQRFKSMEDYKRIKAEEKRAHPLLDQEAPKLELVSIHGDRFALQSMRGKTVVLEFWSTYCNACLQQIPHVDAAIRDANVDAIAFGVNSGENPAMVRGFTSELDWSLTLVGDADSRLTKAFDVATLPMTVVIDPKGTVRQIIKSGLAPEQFQERLTEAIVEAGDAELVAAKP